MTLVPQPAIGSPWLLSPNYTAARAFICQENTFLAYLTVMNSSGTTHTSQAVGASGIIAIIQGACSDGTWMAPLGFNFIRTSLSDVCPGLAFPSGYSYNLTYYNSLDMGTFAQRFSYRQGPFIMCSHVFIQICQLPSYARSQCRYNSSKCWISFFSSWRSQA